MNSGIQGVASLDELGTEVLQRDVEALPARRRPARTLFYSLKILGERSFDPNIFADRLNAPPPGIPGGPDTPPHPCRGGASPNTVFRFRNAAKTKWRRERTPLPKGLGDVSHWSIPNTPFVLPTLVKRSLIA